MALTVVHYWCKLFLSAIVTALDPQPGEPPPFRRLSVHAVYIPAASRRGPRNVPLGVVPLGEFLDGGARSVRRAFTAAGAPPLPPEVAVEFESMLSRASREAEEAPDLAEAAALTLCLVLYVSVSSSSSPASAPSIGAAELDLAVRESLASAEAVPGFGGVPADGAAIEALVTVSEIRDDRERGHCCICMESFDGDDDGDGDDEDNDGGGGGGGDDGDRTVVKTPCSHFYHRDCIVKWLEKSHSCPMCRYAMPISSEISDDLCRQLAMNEHRDGGF